MAASRKRGEENEKEKHCKTRFRARACSQLLSQQSKGAAVLCAVIVSMGMPPVIRLFYTAFHGSISFVWTEGRTFALSLYPHYPAGK